LRETQDPNHNQTNSHGKEKSVRFLSCKSLKNRDKNMVVGLCSVSHGNRTLWGEVVMIVVGIRGLATRSNVTNLPTLTLPLLLLTLLACPFSQIQKKHPPTVFPAWPANILSLSYTKRKQNTKT